MTTITESILQPFPDEATQKLMIQYDLPQEFYDNYKICRNQPLQKVRSNDIIPETHQVRLIGVWDIDEDKKADVIFFNNDKLIKWFLNSEKKEAFIYNLQTITQFYETEVLQLYYKTGHESGQAIYESAGIYHSRSLRYAICKRQDIYSNIIKYGLEHYQNVSDTELVENQQELLQLFLKMALHIALLREELREQNEYKEADYYTKKDPFVQFIKILIEKTK
ncbi:Hypothetical_protein [Hexamita inflata]|uniref:Hypothetical_protein n=1 Tax=Hexamita inflata TaxID=28002 RepID=A0AA86PVS8_9EUKA|nr:Hypothetical protein HINF_LOCUS32213 [Hexamita inflata]